MLCSLFERFTERARQVVVLAQEEARALSHNYIGTEHILLGLLREQEGLGARVLESLEITLERVRAQVRRIVGAGEEITSGQIPFTPRATKVLELALREALSLGHNYIGTEHILLGLVRENEGVGMRILLDFDADAEKIRNEVIRMLAGPGQRPYVTVTGPRPYREESRNTVDASWFGGLADVLQELQSAMGIELGRLPDTADLLLALAAAPDTRAGMALREAGVDLDALAAAVDGVRSADGPTQAELERRMADLRAEREQAAREQEYETAAKLRDEERELDRVLREAQPAPDAITAIWTRLGLSPPG